MSAVVLPLALAGCGSGQKSDEKIIEKPQLEITDGMLTPEVLEGLWPRERGAPLARRQDSSVYPYV